MGFTGGGAGSSSISSSFESIPSIFPKDVAVVPHPFLLKFEDQGGILEDDFGHAIDGP